MFNKTLQLYKAAYSGLSRPTWYLTIVMLINRCGTMVLPFMSIYCTQHLHYNLQQTGLIMACFGVGSIIGALVGGRITDKIGFYYVQIIALLTGGLMFIVVGYLENFIALAIGVFILSICNDSFRPANSTAIAAYCTPENRTRSYSLNRLAMNLGFSIGGALGGFLSSKNYHLLFWVDGLTNIGGACMMLFLLPMKSFTKPASKNKNTSKPHHDKNYLLFLLLVVLFAFCFLQLFGMLNIYFKTQWHIVEQQIGWLMMTNGLLITVIEMLLTHSLDGKKHHLFFMRIGACLVGLGYLAINVAPPHFILAVVCVIIITMGEIFALPFMNSYWLKRTNEDNRGSYAALYTTAWSVAYIAAPVTASTLATYFGFTVLWNIIASIMVVVAIGTWLLQRKDEHHANHI